MILILPTNWMACPHNSTGGRQSPFSCERSLRCDIRASNLLLPCKLSLSQGCRIWRKILVLSMTKYDYTFLFVFG